jgi:hypothetical protein
MRRWWQTSEHAWFWRRDYELASALASVPAQPARAAGAASSVAERRDLAVACGTALQGGNSLRSAPHEASGAPFPGQPLLRSLRGADAMETDAAPAAAGASERRPLQGDAVAGAGVDRAAAALAVCAGVSGDLSRLRGCQSDTTGPAATAKVGHRTPKGRNNSTGGSPENLHDFQGVTEEPVRALHSLTIPPRPESADTDEPPPSVKGNPHDHPARAAISEVRHDV